MARFQGYRCDGCGMVLASEERTRVTHRYKGSVSGEYSEDLCDDCVTVPDGVTLKSLRTRKAQTSSS